LKGRVACEVRPSNQRALTIRLIQSMN
jgi:hypothetical protein